MDLRTRWRVTLRYVHGQPLGKLMMAIATPVPEEPKLSETLPVTTARCQTEGNGNWAGQLILRLNEYGADLDDTAAN